MIEDVGHANAVLYDSSGSPNPNVSPYIVGQPIVLKVMSPQGPVTGTYWYDSLNLALILEVNTYSYHAPVAPYQTSGTLLLVLNTPTPSPAPLSPATEYIQYAINHPQTGVVVDGYYPDHHEFQASATINVVAPTVVETASVVNEIVGSSPVPVGTGTSSSFLMQSTYPSPYPYSRSGVFHQYQVKSGANVDGYLSIAQSYNRCEKVTDVNNSSVFVSETPAPASPVALNIVDGSVPYMFGGAYPDIHQNAVTPEPHISPNSSLAVQQFDSPAVYLNVLANEANQAFPNLGQVNQIDDLFNGVDAVMFYPSASISGGPANIWVSISQDSWTTGGTAYAYENAWYGENSTSTLNTHSSTISPVQFVHGVVQPLGYGGPLVSPAPVPSSTPPCGV